MADTPEAHGARFDEKADEYDEDHPPEYESCLSLVVDHARDGLGGDEVVLDVGTGTGAVALRLADDAGRVVGRDVSEGMLARARGKADERGVENATFREGRFRDPNYDARVDAESAAPPRAPARDARVDLVVSNFAMHHLTDAEKREAISVLAGLGPRRIVLGDVMLFGEADPEAPFYDPAVDDPATVGVLADAFTDAGHALTAVERVHEQVGVLVADRVAADGTSDDRPGGE